LQVVEIFYSLQGEGTLIGTPMVFIRLWGCNMQCIWCDTRYSWAPEFKSVTKRLEYDPRQVVDLLSSYQKISTWINFTGGEPTIWKDEIEEVIDHTNGTFKSCIQTNGKTWFDSLFSKIDKICMDFKCPGSGEVSQLSLLRRLREQDEAKFVILDEKDFQYTLKALEEFRTQATIIIQPVLRPQDSYEAYFEKIRCLVSKLSKQPIKNLRILPQYHQLLWRDQPGH
jgi:7-carboxy-7-deazaguanine synthase